TDQDEIAEKVAGLGQRGVSTSAFGLGLDFDEDLMAAIATAGDGSMAHIESPQQLEDLYASELQGLATTIGRRVSLGIRAKHGAELVDVVNDLTLTDFGNHQLANLRQGQELNVAMRLQLPAWRANQEICSVRLAWDQPGADSRSSLVEQLILPVKPAAEVNELESDQAVIEEFAVLKANRSRRQALEELDQDDYQAAESRLNMVHADLSCLKPSKRRDRELHLIKAKQALLKTDHNRARKGLRRESLRSSLDVWDAE
ncbi:MAG: hypothetical protein GY914_12690, partial [Prochlorococcus sp.]|nr:hypothetical protein [Prochlorococcus sp.]